MIESMLEPHMKNEAGSTQMDVGLAFLILGGLYMIMSVTAGFVSTYNFIFYLVQYAMVNLNRTKPSCYSK
jgi:hypothetical protein